jgi:hypothetical protein
MNDFSTAESQNKHIDKVAQTFLNSSSAILNASD